MRNQTLVLVAGWWIAQFLLVGCASQVPHEKTLGDQLRTGGYVIFFRHGATDKMVELDTVDLADCGAQRNLNALGRTQAQRIGAAFRAARIPVDEVRASAYCRCLDTARLAFEHTTQEDVLTSYLRVPEAMRPQRIIALKDLLAQVPKPGRNTVLVGHHNMFRDAAAIVLEEGEAAIVEPLAAGQFRVVAQVRPEYWEKVL